MTSLYSEIRSAAFTLLGHREHSRKELERKLKARFPEDPEELQRVLEDMQTSGLQSDERYVELFIRSRISRGQGPVKIRYDLQQAGIASDKIETQLELGDDWYEMAYQIAESKLSTRTWDRKAQERMGRFLLQRGFPSNIIHRVLIQLGKNTTL